MIVIDASVAIKWVQEEIDTDKARLLQKNHLEGKNQIVVPQLIFYEIANALATKAKATPTDIKTAISLIFKHELRVYRESEIDLIQSTQLAKKYHTTVYDMLYAIIAKKHSTSLVTADENFISKTRFKFVKHLKEISS